MPVGQYDRSHLRKNVVGETYGRLTIVADAKDRGTARYVRCKCECGTEKDVRLGNLVTGKVTSCGCLVKELGRARKKHGKAHSAEWSVWKNIIRRCTKPKDKAYHHYGGRGITVCDEWLVFENFWRDMGDRPSPDMQIDRVDNEKGYSKDNCRWASRTENMHNRRIYKNNSSGVKGVMRNGKNWHAELKINGEKVLSKTFTKIEDAIAARKAAEKLYLGR